MIDQIDLSTPHNPNRHEEATRVMEAGGWIDVERVINLLQKRIDMTDPEIQNVVGLRLDEDKSYEVSRVVGDLSVSRSIGDPDYKGFVPGQKVDLCLNWPKDHDKTFVHDLIIAEPDIETIELGSDDEFLIMASDGVWDVMTPAQAVHKVRTEFMMGLNAEEAAAALCDLAYRLGSSDNITAVVVTFFYSN